MSEIVFFLEEDSAKAMLEGLLPKIFPDDLVRRFIVFEGKQDLEKQMVRRMKGYLVPDARFVVLRDQDSGDYQTVKDRLLERCREANKKSTLVCIACHELESWYLADLAAVEHGLGVSNLARLQEKNPYRAPDILPRPSERLAKIAPYQKLGGSRAIGPHLDPRNGRSRSFQNFVTGIQELLSKEV